MDAHTHVAEINARENPLMGNPVQRLDLRLDLNLESRQLDCRRTAIRG